MTFDIEYILITVQSQSLQVQLDQLPMIFTMNGVHHNDNNLIRVDSSQLAQNYLVKFEEMFLDHQTGSDSPANTANPILNVGVINSDMGINKKKIAPYLELLGECFP